jgi:hypothetical protein
MNTSNKILLLIVVFGTQHLIQSKRLTTKLKTTRSTTNKQPKIDVNLRLLRCRLNYNKN